LMFDVRCLILRRRPAVAYFIWLRVVTCENVFADLRSKYFEVSRPEPTNKMFDVRLLIFDLAATPGWLYRWLSSVSLDRE
jgi:hypothetical protein